VERFHRITTALPSGPARAWLAEIGTRLDAELDAVARLATVGDSIEPARYRLREQPARRIAARLDTAGDGFTDAVTQAAEIAEQVAVDPAHSDVNAHLEVLSKQASQLALAPEEPAAEPGPRRWLRRRRA
jgi:alkylhydroperoxidase family enzyme